MVVKEGNAMCVEGGAMSGEGSAMGVLVEPSAREAFTPRELTDAFKDFIEHGPQYLDAETGIKAWAYRFGERVLLVYEEAETGMVVLTYPTSQRDRPKSPEGPRTEASELGEGKKKLYFSAECQLNGGATDYSRP